LSDNQIEDIFGLSGLTNLEKLYLCSNQINDVSTLSGLSNLNYVSLLDNPLNIAAYYIYLPFIEHNSPELKGLDYDPNPYLLVDDWGDELSDVTVFMEYFGEDECGEGDNWCDGADLDHSGAADRDDVAEFARYVVRGTEE
jgi:hypothetical protein